MSEARERMLRGEYKIVIDSLRGKIAPLEVALENLDHDLAEIAELSRNEARISVHAIAVRAQSSIALAHQVAKSFDEIVNAKMKDVAIPVSGSGHIPLESASPTLELPWWLLNAVGMGPRFLAWRKPCAAKESLRRVWPIRHRLGKACDAFGGGWL